MQKRVVVTRIAVAGEEDRKVNGDSLPDAKITVVDEYGKMTHMVVPSNEARSYRYGQAMELLLRPIKEE